MKSIRSASNPFFTKLVKLAATARARHEASLTLLEGFHLAQEVARTALLESMTLVIADSGFDNANIASVAAMVAEEKIVALSDALFGKVSSGKGENAVLAVIPIDSLASLHPVKHSGFQLWLDRIQDPGNVGAIIRTAAAAGANTVLLNRGCADAWSPKCLRAAMGAHLHVHVGSDANLAESIASFEGRVYAAHTDAAANSVFDSDLAAATAIILGNEGEGVASDLLQRVNGYLRIPMVRDVESLNVAAAAAVIAFEHVRQRARLGR